jgi:hypothetical protein
MLEHLTLRLPENPYQPSQSEPRAGEDSLDEMIHLNTRILNTKLEVIGSHVAERLRIHRRNLERIDEDKTLLMYMLRKIREATRYHLTERDERRILYQKFFELEEERREQDVECWRDLVLVMRDGLTFWDAHEHAKSRAIFLDHAGT